MFLIWCRFRHVKKTILSPESYEMCPVVLMRRLKCGRLAHLSQFEIENSALKFSALIRLRNPHQSRIIFLSWPPYFLIWAATKKSLLKSVQVLGPTKTILVLMISNAYLGETFPPRKLQGMVLAVVGMIAYAACSLLKPSPPASPPKDSLKISEIQPLITSREK
jgi:multidrug transporter EmrE-like cation transporter